MVVRLNGSVEMVAAPEMRRVSTVEDGGCTWMALTEPPTAPLVAATAAEFTATGGFEPPSSKPSFAV